MVYNFKPHWLFIHLIPLAHQLVNFAFKSPRRTLQVGHSRAMHDQICSSPERNISVSSAVWLGERYRQVTKHLESLTLISPTIHSSKFAISSLITNDKSSL